MDKLDTFEKKIRKTAVLGPHDRMNYGDFLFPKMLDYSFSKMLKREVQLAKYSLIKSDFSEIGAFKSKGFKQLTQDINKGEIDTVIVAGGECLSARWDNLYSYISPVYNFFYRQEWLRKNRIFRNIPKF